jgi:hypothetical protein
VRESSWQQQQQQHVPHDLSIGDISHEKKERILKLCHKSLTLVCVCCFLVKQHQRQQHKAKGKELSVYVLKCSASVGLCSFMFIYVE